MKKFLSTSSLARIIAAALLVYSLKRHAYDYYTLLRWITFGVGLYSAILAVKIEERGWAITLGILAMIFNPFIPVHFDRETWRFIDLMAAALLLASVYFIQEKSKQASPGSSS